MGRLHQAAQEYVRRAAARKKAAKAQAGRLTNKPRSRAAFYFHTADFDPAHLRCIVLAAREPHGVLDVVERLFVGAGSSALMASNPLQRYWRDAHAVRMHTGSDYDVSKLHHGRNLLGLMPTPDL